MNKYFLFFAMPFLSIACKDYNKIIAPFEVVVKLQSAETLADFEEARKYIDVEKVYSNPYSMDPYEAWRKDVYFFYNLGEDKKFTNLFTYFDYDISETLKRENATVTFKSLSSKAYIKEIIYKLKIVQNKWMVVGIEYVKNNVTEKGEINYQRPK